MRPKSAVITNGFGTNTSSAENGSNRRSLEESSMANQIKGTKPTQFSRDTNATDNLSTDKSNGNSFVSICYYILVVVVVVVVVVYCYFSRLQKDTLTIRRLWLIAVTYLLLKLRRPEGKRRVILCKELLACY